MTKQEPTYSALRAELDELLVRFESADHTDIDALLADYKKGMKLIASLKVKLEEAALEVKKIAS